MSAIRDDGVTNKVSAVLVYVRQEGEGASLPKESANQRMNYQVGYRNQTYVSSRKNHTVNAMKDGAIQETDRRAVRQVLGDFGDWNCPGGEATAEQLEVLE